MATKKKGSSYEGSKLDKKLDKATGFKEGSKRDKAVDSVASKFMKFMKKKKKG